MTPYMDTVFGLGVFIENRGGIKYFNHNGGNEAFLCTSYGSLEGGNGVVIMINGEDFSIINEVLNSVAQVYDWKGFYKPVFKKLIVVPKDTLQQYVGDYKMDKDTLTIHFCGEELCIRQNSQPGDGFKMKFSNNASFTVIEVPNAIISILRNKEGKIDALELTQDGNTRRLPKLN